MHFNELQTNAAKFLAKISIFYQNYFLGSSSKQFKNGYEALEYFLDGYAYERQGAAKAYKKIALKCISIRYLNGRNWKPPTKEDAEVLWNDYKDIAKNEYSVKANGRCNPLNMDRGVINKLASNNTENIAVYIKELIENGKTIEAHKFIKVHGIGEKIASFYLRDIICLSGLDENKIKDLYLLQPIDTWLEQTLKILFNSNVPETLQEKQELIVDLCKESKVSSISFNQGAWVLGSQIAGEYETFENVLKDHEEAKEIIDKHIKEKQEYLDQLKKLRKELVLSDAIKD